MGKVKKKTFFDTRVCFQFLSFYFILFLIKPLLANSLLLWSYYRIYS